MKTFTEKVYEIVKRIPAGKVMTYQDVALKAGSPKAYRAVASLMAKNYNPLIPCHRVIRSDGGLGGYNRGGIMAKRKLLSIEGYLI
jgi:methylated-DNA-[protein]-cysteine S-methyltransferase